MKNKNFKQLRTVLFVASFSVSFTALGQGNTSIGNQAGSTSKGKYNSYFGAGAGKSNATGKLNTFIGHKAGNFNTSGNNNVYIGYYAGYFSAGSGNVIIGHEADGSGSNQLIIGNDKDHTLISGDFSNASLGVNGTFTVTGDAFKPGGGNWIASSDRRLKRDIRAFTDGWEMLQKIRPVRFRYNGKADMPTDKDYIGVIAQEMQQAAPYTIDSFTHITKDGSQTEYLKYDATAVHYILVNTIKAQQKRIRAQEQSITALENQLAETTVEAHLQKRISTLEKLVSTMHGKKAANTATASLQADTKDKKR